MSFLIFNAVLALVAGYALVRGGAPERIVAGFFFLAAVASAAVPSIPSNYFSVFWALMWIDLALLVGLAAVALVADRYWPLWLAALQLVAVAAHGAKGYRAEIWAQAYWLLTSYIGFPMVLILLLGTIRHRERKAAGLPERAWSAWGRSHDGGAL